MQEFLRYLVETDLAGNSDHLRSANIAIDVFGKGEGFDPNSDSIVRVEAARLRKLLSSYYEVTPGTSLEISVPKGRYVPAYQSRHPAEPNSRPRLISGPGIAILPFTAEPKDARLRDGITTELRFQLSRFAEFRVIDATSLMETSPVELLDAAAHKLNCQYLVQGRIAAYNGGMRIHTEAIDTQSADVRWSDRLDIKSDRAPLINIEEEVARFVARSLAPAPGSIIINGFERSDRPPTEWDADDCVLRWHFYRIHSRSQDAFDTLVLALKNLLDRYPNYSLGWAMLGFMTLDAWVYRMRSDQTFEALERDARTYAGRALGLAPKNSPAHFVLGLCDYFGGNYSGFKAHYRTALELNPNSLDLLHHGGALLAFGGNWSEGQRAVLDAGLKYSNTMGLRFFYVVDALRSKDLLQADQLLSVVKPGGKWYWGHLLRAVIAEQQGELDKAKVSLSKAHADCPALKVELQEEVDKWFGDQMVRELMLGSFDRLNALN